MNCSEKKERKNSVIAYFVIMATADLAIFGTQLNRLYIVWGILLLAVTFIGIMGGCNVVLCVCGAIATILLLIGMVLNRDYHGYSIMVSIYVCAILCSFIHPSIICNCLQKFVFVISSISLVIEICYFIRPQFLMTFPDFIGYQGKVNVFGMCVLREALQFETTKYRNYGCFNEPSIFAIYIGIAIALELMNNHKSNFFHLLILNVTMISTLSITGYLAITFLYISLVVVRKIRLDWEILRDIAVLIAPISEYRLNIPKYILSRIDLNGPSSHSVWSRISSFLVPMQIWKTKPLFGVGATRTLVQFDELVLAEYGSGYCLTNQIAYYFAAFGMQFGVWCCVGVFLFAYSFSKKVADGFIFFFLFVILLAGNTLSYSNLPFLIIFMGYSFLIENARDNRGAYLSLRKMRN